MSTISVTGGSIRSTSPSQELLYLFTPVRYLTSSKLTGKDVLSFPGTVISQNNLAFRNRKSRGMTGSCQVLWLNRTRQSPIMSKRLSLSRDSRIQCKCGGCWAQAYIAYPYSLRPHVKRANVVY